MLGQWKTVVNGVLKVGQSSLILKSISIKTCCFSSKQWIGLSNQRYSTFKKIDFKTGSTNDESTANGLPKWVVAAGGTIIIGCASTLNNTGTSSPVLCSWFSIGSKTLNENSNIQDGIKKEDDEAPSVHQLPESTSTVTPSVSSYQPTLKHSSVRDSSNFSKTGSHSFKGDEDNDSVTSDINPLWRSKQSRPFEKKFEETAIFCGTSNKILAENIAEHLGTKLGRIRLKRFADGEVSLQFLDSIRGKDVYIIQATSPPVNENLMELLLMISTCRRSSAKKITAVIPYYGYARQDRKLSSRVPISAADVARMIEAMGVDRVISVDLHSGQIQGFFGPHVPVDNLEAQLIGLEYFCQKKLEKPVVVSPDAGGVYRARKFQEGLRLRGATDCGIAMLVKQRLRANEIERMDVVGNVEGCDVVIVDDMIDTGGTLCEAANQLRKRGAKRVFAFATHGLFSNPALTRIENSVLEEVVVCDTIQLSPEAAKSNRITQLSLAVLIADAIRRIHQKESLEQLFMSKFS